MNSQQLINLIEILKCRSMSEASQNLHLTPQALSISMKNLEKELGFSILSTTFSGTKLTEKGELLAELSSKFLADVSLLKDDQSLSTAYETILFPSLSGICSIYLPDLYNYLNQFTLKRTVDFSSYSPEKLIEKVQGNVLPYGILYQGFLDNKPLLDIQELGFYEIKKVDVHVMFHINHPLAKYKKVSLKTLLKYPWVNVASSDSILENLFCIIGKPYSLNIVPTTELLPTYFQNNTSAILLTYSIAKNLSSDEFITAQLNENFSSSLGIIYNTSHSLSAQKIEHLKILIDFFRIQLS